MDLLSYIFQPVITSAMTAIILGIGLLVTLWKGYHQIFVAIKTVADWTKEHIVTWTCFYWVVNLVCMAFSAQNAGYIFGLYEGTGLLVGVALDLLIIAFTQAMLAAKARGERSRAKKILAFIVFCCLLSTTGNLAHNLHTNIAGNTSGVWFEFAIPYLVSTMPLFLIALAWVADLRVNPLASMNVDAYKADEQKRLDFLETQIETRESHAKLEQRLITVEALEKRNKQLRKGKAPRSFRWPWEPKIDISYIVANVADNMKVFYDEKIKEVSDSYQGKIEDIQRLSLVKQTELEVHIQGLVAQIRQGILLENETYRLALAEQYDQDVSLLQERIEATLSSAQNQRNASEKPSARTAHRREKSGQSDELIALDEKTQLVISRYPIVTEWLARSDRSVSLQEIIAGTGQPYQRVHRAAKGKAFWGTRREGYYRLESVISWLETAPLSNGHVGDHKPIENGLSPVLSEDNGHSNGHKKTEDPTDNLIPLEV